jgi:hypothetical protein
VLSATQRVHFQKRTGEPTGTRQSRFCQRWNVSMDALRSSIETERKPPAQDDKVSDQRDGNLVDHLLDVLGKLEPPGLAPLRACFDAPDQIALADDSDQLSILSNNGRGADPVLQQDNNSAARTTPWHRLRTRTCGLGPVGKAAGQSPRR